MAQTVRLITFFLMAIMLCCIVVYAQNGGTGKRKSDSNERDLLGPVHVVRIESELIESVDKNDTGGGWVPSLITFDRVGNIEESVQYDGGGQVHVKVVAEMDKAGNKVKEVHTDNSGNILNTWLWEYDAEGNPTDFKCLRADGAIDSWSKALFDKEGKRLSHTALTAEGNVIFINRVTYNGDGKMSGESVTFIDGKPSDHNVITYSSENGTEKEETSVIDSKGILKYRYVDLINKKGDETEFSYDGAGKLLDEQTCEYSKRDSHGNWTVEIACFWEDKDGELVLKTKNLTKRTITYY
jgi:hypothetical protein